MQNWQKNGLLKNTKSYVRHYSQVKPPKIKGKRVPMILKGSETPSEYGGQVEIKPNGETKMADRRFTAAIVVDKENDLFSVATAVAHPIDNNKFSKKIGRCMATGRARKLLAAYLENNEAPDYNSYSGVFKLSEVTPEIIGRHIAQSEKWVGWILKQSS